MSKMKDLIADIEILYSQGYTVLAIARQLKISTQAVLFVVNQPKE